MSDVKGQALLPKGEGNGLTEIATDLLKDMGRMRVVIGFVNCRRKTIERDGTEKATVEFHRIEVLLPGDLAEAERLLRRALESRSGQEQLPLELEDEISAAFRDLDVDAMEAEAREHPDDETRGEGGQDEEPGGGDDQGPKR
jgi:hypothetical protein